MPSPHNPPSLYGITKENSSRHGNDLWSKNKFNSTFPLSLCLFMRDEGVNPVSVISQDGKICSTDLRWGMGEVIGAKRSNPYYNFEKIFDENRPFLKNASDTDNIDVVVSFRGIDSIPLEIKLTVVPDSGTASQDATQWGPELVLRPVSSAYAMMRLSASLMDAANIETKQQVANELFPVYSSVVNWADPAEIFSKADRLRKALSAALKAAEALQRPFLVQPIWRTKGQSLSLCKQCFDVFVWSDVAMMRVPIDRSNNGRATAISRPLREIARHVRAMVDILGVGVFSYEEIYKGMSSGRQTDKVFSIAGRITRGYLKHRRLQHPHYERDILQKIILNGGETKLKPERRFDLAVLAEMVK